MEQGVEEKENWRADYFVMGDQLDAIKIVAPTWWFMPTGGTGYRIGLNSAPCWFHRLIQRLIFGFRYRRVDGA